MKSVSKTLLTVGFSFASQLLSAADNQRGEVFNIDCTATYTKDGKTDSTNPHGTISLVNGSGKIGLRNHIIPSNYIANLEINFRPEDDVSHWVASFMTEESETILKQKRQDLILESSNKIEMDYSPNPSEVLTFSCTLSKQPRNSSITNDTRDGELNFDYVAVIRELNGATDNAALFGVLPNQEGLETTKIIGPGFLGGARVGTLDALSMSKLFKRTSIPMSDGEKQALVEKYQGAKAIYFEGYNGKLCAGTDQIYSIIIEGKIGEQITSSNFTFAALPTHNGNCRFATLSTTTMSHN